MVCQSSFLYLDCFCKQKVQIIIFVFNKMEDSRCPLEDYYLLSVIGKGSYAKVVLARKKVNGNLYALKSMKKKYI
jgi:hypothetical protein